MSDENKLNTVSEFEKEMSNTADSLTNNGSNPEGSIDGFKLGYTACLNSSIVKRMEFVVENYIRFMPNGKLKEEARKVLADLQAIRNEK